MQRGTSFFGTRTLTTCGRARPVSSTSKARYFLVFEGSTTYMDNFIAARVASKSTKLPLLNRPLKTIPTYLPFRAQRSRKFGERPRLMRGCPSERCGDRSYHRRPGSVENKRHRRPLHKAPAPKSRVAKQLITSMNVIASVTEGTKSRRTMLSVPAALITVVVAAAISARQRHTRKTSREGLHRRPSIIDGEATLVVATCRPLGTLLVRPWDRTCLRLVSSPAAGYPR